jgi:hypothetical protein
VAQVIGGNGNADTITRKNSDVVAAHATGELCADYSSSLIDLDVVLPAAEGVLDYALHFEEIALAHVLRLACLTKELFAGGSIAIRPPEASCMPAAPLSPPFVASIRHRYSPLRRGGAWVLSLGLALVAPADAFAARLGPGTSGWVDRELGAIRGITVGPIESSLHPDKGYGSPPFQRSLSEVRRLGGNWVSLTPFGRVLNLEPTGISLTFEQPFEDNRKAVLAAIRQARAQGLRVMLVPHLWVESGGWRGEIEPGDEAAWQRWSDAYRAFVLTWAEVAELGGAEMLAVGVELRSWVTTARAPSFVDIVRAVREKYSGLLTYAANWDDVEDTVILGELDLIGVNAFFPLAEHEGASFTALQEGGQRVAARLKSVAELWDKPIVLTEFGYTTRKDPAVRPWEWPDHMSSVTVDEGAQADAYAALLAPLLDAPFVAGAFLWRLYADPDDVSQEAEWGFSPRGKLAELVLRDAFAAHWASDGPAALGASLLRTAAETPGVF